MKAALIKNEGYNIDTPDERYQLEVVKVVDVSSTYALNDFRKNFGYEYAIPVDGNVEVGMLFDPDNYTILDRENGSQVYPPISATEEINKLQNELAELTYNVDEDSLTLDELKDYLIRKNKKNLSDYLYNHPMEYNGKSYTITEDKQNQLTGILNAYQYAKAIGVELPLTWNETGGVCELYTFEELVEIYLQMLAVVKPIVTYQQHQEIEIRNAESKETAQAVDITFDNFVAEETVDENITETENN